MKNPLVTVTSDSLEDEKLKLIDDPDFNALIADKLQNSRFLNDLIGVRKECLRQKRVLDDKISQIMDKHHLNVLNTIEATVQISYYPTVEIIDENVVSKRYKVLIDERKILKDFRLDELDECGIQISEDIVVSCKQRKGKARMKDVQKQKKRLGLKYGI